MINPSSQIFYPWTPMRAQLVQWLRLQACSYGEVQAVIATNEGSPDVFRHLKLRPDGAVEEGLVSVYAGNSALRGIVRQLEELSFEELGALIDVFLQQGCVCP